LLSIVISLSLSSFLHCVAVVESDVAPPVVVASVATGVVSTGELEEPEQKSSRVKLLVSCGRKSYCQSGVSFP